MIYLYGLLDPTAEDPAPALADEAGVTGPVEVATFGQGHLVYGPHDGGEIRPKRRLMLAHARVQERLLEHGTVLPMRFGLVADDTRFVETLLAAQADAIGPQFDRLSGQIEIGVRVAFEETAVLARQLDLDPTLAAERAHLLRSGGAARAHFATAEFGRKLGEAAEARRTEAQRALIKALRPHVTDLVIRAPETAFQVLAADVLIHRDRQDDFETTLTDLSAALDFAAGAEPEIRLVGPAPVYNFVRLNLADTREAAA